MANHSAEQRAALAWFRLARPGDARRAFDLASKADSKMAKRQPNGYYISMTALEHDILDRLTKLEATVKTMPTANPKPNLLPLFQQIEELAGDLPQGTAPDLLHYMQRKSYEKARQWLEGRYAEIQKGGCLR